MRNQLIHHCGKIVYTTRKLERKSCDSLSSLTHIWQLTPIINSVQTSFIRYSFRQFTTQFSPHLFTNLPLFEHYFYPVSTAPITYYDHNKIKERY